MQYTLFHDTFIVFEDYDQLMFKNFRKNIIFYNHIQ